jgi:RNA polymerase sigma-70 factor (ECF subfamily)
MTTPALDFADEPEPSTPDFDAFYARWYPIVVSYARRFGPSQAEEVAQETLVRAYSCFETVQRDLPWPWLRTVARNVACDLHRAGKRLRPLPDGVEQDVADVGPTLEEVALGWERRRDLRAALGAISPEDRQLLHMSLIDEISVEDIASELAVTSNAVRVRLHRARRRLGKQYLVRAGQFALGVPVAIVAAARHVLRPSANAATRSGPALAAMAAVGGLAATGLVLSQPAWPSASPAVAVANQSAAPVHAATSAPAARLTPTSATAPRVTAAAASTGRPAATDGIRTHLQVTNNPKRPGTVADAGIAVPTPAGSIWVSTETIRSTGVGSVCRQAVSAC